METLTDLIKSLKIKSIQRGVANLSSGTISIVISNINSDKSIVIINSSPVIETGGTAGVYLSELTDNSIKLASSNGGGYLTKSSNTLKISYEKRCTLCLIG